VSGLLWERSVLQLVVLVVLFFIAFPQTKLYSARDFGFPGQKTVAYALAGGPQQDFIEELASESGVVTSLVSWRDKGLSANVVGSSNRSYRDYELSGIIAGGSAITKPFIMPGSSLIPIKRYDIEVYEVQPGDSLGTIAQDFGVSVATVLWENNLTPKSLIRPGDKLKVPPVTGVMHTVKKGDNLKKIASLYGGTVEEITLFNDLKENGTNLKLGARIMVPNGIKPQQQAIAAIKRTDVSRVALPPPSRQVPTGGGFVWPSGVHTITQYYGLKHPALDIAGPFGTPTYASKAGVVEKSACGWNSGYGCYVVIDHGGGIKTLYGHHSKLLVSPGDQVDTGQTIALMGNTGRVYGRTGIHLHFEIRVNGVRVNPLGYVK
jgi:murein DD-endopeptidase MepM/ murein hydrolase activator NlpD